MQTDPKYVFVSFYQPYQSRRILYLPPVDQNKRCCYYSCSTSYQKIGMLWEGGRLICSCTQGIRRGFPCRRLLIYVHKISDFVEFHVTCVHERWFALVGPEEFEGSLEKRCAFLNVQPLNAARDTIAPVVKAGKGTWRSLVEGACVQLRDNLVPRAAYHAERVCERRWFYVACAREGGAAFE